MPKSLGTQNEEKDKRYVTFRENTTSKLIMDMLALYGECTLDQLTAFIERKGETIQKAICKLDSLGYVNTRMAWGKKIVMLSKMSKKHLCIADKPQEEYPMSERKLIRRARASEVKMAFSVTAPETQTSIEDSFIDIKDIKNQYNEIAIKLSRMFGIYSHGGRHYAVFNIGGGIAWNQNVEQKAREWIRDVYLNGQLNAQIIFVRDMNAAIRTLTVGKGKQSLTTRNTAYNKMIVFPLSREGHMQLKLFRSLDDPHNQLSQLIFSDNEINRHGNSLYDGLIKNDYGTRVPAVALFVCDMMRVDSVIGLASSNAVATIYVACFDIQEEFYEAVFNEYPQVEILSYPFKAICEKLLNQTLEL